MKSEKKVNFANFLFIQTLNYLHILWHTIRSDKQSSVKKLELKSNRATDDGNCGQVLNGSIKFE